MFEHTNKKPPKQTWKKDSVEEEEWEEEEKEEKEVREVLRGV